MIIFEDTGQKIGQHDMKNQQMKELGVTVKRFKLPCGDYMVPTGSISVDTKANLEEMYGNLIQDHARLSNEIKLARDCNIKLIFLIEHGDDIRCIDDVVKWENPQVEKYRMRVKTILSKLNLVKKFGKYSLEELLTIANDNAVKLPKPPAPNEQLIKSMHTLSERYGCEFKFTDKSQCGKRIIELLGGD